jgi:predicted  nucleic acid-binding Zn-ribbon protein
MITNINTNLDEQKNNISELDSKLVAINSELDVKISNLQKELENNIIEINEKINNLLKPPQNK